MTSPALRPPALVLALSILSLAPAGAGCGSGTGGTGGGGGAGGSSSSSSSSSSTSSSTGTPFNWDTACHDCLQNYCHTEIVACDSECVAIQACIDAICGHLSQLGVGTEEGQCQVQCQNKHSAGKAAHLALVNCAQGSTNCAPPCKFAIYDWEQCNKAQAQGTCKAQLDTCNGDAACQTYQACAGGCATNVACQGCSTGTDGKAGEQAYEAYWQCVEGQCLPEAWLPQF
jgi:hypothetical protein